MDSVFLLKPEWIKYVLSQPESFPRYLDLFKGFFPLLGDGILASTGDDHSFQKKILSKAFAKGNILKYIPAFNKHVEVLVRVSLWPFCLFLSFTFFVHYFYTKILQPMDFLTSKTFSFSH